jgi:hypothetical protein
MHDVVTLGELAPNAVRGITTRSPARSRIKVPIADDHPLTVQYSSDIAHPGCIHGVIARQPEHLRDVHGCNKLSEASSGMLFLSPLCILRTTLPTSKSQRREVVRSLFPPNARSGPIRMMMRHCDRPRRAATPAARYAACSPYRYHEVMLSSTAEYLK